MKVAHLILAHQMPDQLENLIRKLMHADAAFYIHLDKKTNISPFLYLEKLDRVFFIKNRVKVYWGAYSIVQSVINSFEEILKSGKKYDYLNLLSGSDYPIKKTQEIHDYLHANNGKAFTEFYLMNHPWWKQNIGRLSKYHLIDFNFPGKYAIQKILHTRLSDRKLPKNIEIVGRSQWFTIPFPCVEYIMNYVKENKKFTRFFKFTWAPDESFFQTILYNSHFKETMLNDNLRFIIFPEGEASPILLTDAHFTELSKSEKLFARKFDLNKAPAIYKMIDQLHENAETAYI